MSVLHINPNDKRIGLCLGCGRRLTFCGKPFTANIQCRKCGYMNVFVESQKPKAGTAR